MLEIDDAGGGCFIGPEVIVIHRLETNASWYLEIPPQVQERVACATQLLKDAFQRLAFPKTEPVRLCRGELFDPIQLYLAEQGYQVLREKVSVATDGLAEQRFLEILHSYGLPQHLTLQDRDYHHFYQLVGCWYYSQTPPPSKRIQKARLRPPFWLQRLGRRFPNLVRLLLEEEAV